MAGSSSTAAPLWLHRAWLLAYSLLLAYGMMLYLHSAEPRPAVQRLIKQQNWHSPALLSQAMESQLTVDLSRRRHPYLRGLSYAKLALLHTAFIHKVVPGKEDFLFLGEEVADRPVDRQSCGQYRYRPSRLDQVTRLLRQRAAWTVAAGMQYVLVIAPNKASIYPEYLPGRYRQLPHTATDQLLDQLPAHIPVIDLRPCLLAQKSYGQLYLPTDTHWNERGAFAGYQCVLQALPTPYAGEPMQDTVMQDTLHQGGDVARLLLVEDTYATARPLVRLRQDGARLLPAEKRSVRWLAPWVYKHTDSERPVALFAHDSFFEPLRPWLAQHFRKSYFVREWQGFPQGLIEQEGPELVIDEWVERSLIGDLPRNPWRVVQHWWQRHFEELEVVASSDQLPLKKVVPWMERQVRSKEAAFSVVRLDVELPKGEQQLHIRYDDAEEHYPLPQKKAVVYLEHYPGRIKALSLVGHAAGARVRATFSHPPVKR